VPRVDYDKLTSSSRGERSAPVRERVVRATAVQEQRLAASPATCNAEMSPKDVAAFCHTTAGGKDILHTAMRQLHLSARAPHIAEALQYRKREGD